MNVAVMEMHMRAEARTPTRVALGAIATLGSALYAASFIGHAEVPVRWGVAVAALAGGSWTFAGLAALAMEGLRDRLPRFVDVCLVTMAIGMAPLMFAAAANALGVGGVAMHVALIGGSATVMTFVFFSSARRAGVPTGAAARWWILLQLTFATGMGLLVIGGVL